MRRLPDHRKGYHGRDDQQSSWLVRVSNSGWYAVGVFVFMLFGLWVVGWIDTLFS